MSDSTKCARNEPERNAAAMEAWSRVPHSEMGVAQACPIGITDAEQTRQDRRSVSGQTDGNTHHRNPGEERDSNLSHNVLTAKAGFTRCTNAESNTTVSTIAQYRHKDTANLLPIGSKLGHGAAVSEISVLIAKVTAGVCGQAADVASLLSQLSLCRYIVPVLQSLARFGPAVTLRGNSKCRGLKWLTARHPVPASVAAMRQCFQRPSVPRCVPKPSAARGIQWDQACPVA